ncbi:MAG TPA: hypothetical protein VFW02_03150 [Candidatus Limnocylindrales bacterium]|nr:hypothetical protein [Candidatus Limnocylindrales bacterium]
MPFGLGRKKEAPPASTSGDEAVDPRDQEPRGVRFHGLTEEWRLQGSMAITGRLLDTLNKREAIELADVTWAPLDGSAPFEPAPGIQAVDPYDLIVVFAGPESLATLADDERTAHRIHKITFDVALEVPPLRVIGTVQLHPGSEPSGLLDRSTQMFVAVTNPSVWLAGAEVDLGPDIDVVLVNRFYLRGVEQVDLATRERHARLPGMPLGGTTWRERS